MGKLHIMDRLLLKPPKLLEIGCPIPFPFSDKIRCGKNRRPCLMLSKHLAGMARIIFMVCDNHCFGSFLRNARHLRDKWLREEPMFFMASLGPGIRKID